MRYFKRRHLLHGRGRSFDFAQDDGPDLRYEDAEFVAAEKELDGGVAGKFAVGFERDVGDRPVTKSLRALK